MGCGAAPNDSLVLSLVELCRNWHPIDRALAMVAAACPRQDRAALPALPLGDRDIILLDLRERLFGPVLDLSTDCPQCSTLVTLAPAIEALWQDEPDAAERAAASAVEIGDRALQLRPVDSRDLAAAARAGDAAEARHILAARCLADETGAGVDPAVLDDALLDEIAARLARLDPQADLAFALDCPECGHAWEAPLDIGAVLWRELQWKAEALIGEIHELALHYHWSEGEILGIGPARRAAYLRLIRA